MGIELDWLNKHYFAGNKSGEGNDGMLHKRRAVTNYFGPNIPPEWVDAWISVIVKHETDSFGISLDPHIGALPHCVPLRVRVNEWMLGI